MHHTVTSKLMTHMRSGMMLGVLIPVVLHYYQCCRPKLKGVSVSLTPWVHYYKVTSPAYTQIKMYIRFESAITQYIPHHSEPHTFDFLPDSLRLTSRVWTPEVERLCTWLCHSATWSRFESFWDTVLKWLKKMPRIGQVRHISVTSQTECYEGFPRLACWCNVLSGFVGSLRVPLILTYTTSAVNGFLLKTLYPLISSNVSETVSLSLRITISAEVF